MDDEALERAIQELLDAIGSGRGESEIDALIDHLESLSPMPDISDLIFIKGVESAQDILRHIKEYKPISL